MSHKVQIRMVLIYATSVALVVCLVRELKHRGGPLLETPTTIVAHTWTGENPTHDVIMLCKRARGLIPRDATVTVIRPSQAPDYEATFFLAAVGNLPRHRVVAPRLDPGVDVPQYLIAVRGSFSDVRYEKFAEFPEGTVWKRKS